MINTDFTEKKKIKTIFPGASLFSLAMMLMLCSVFNSQTASAQCDAPVYVPWGGNNANLYAQGAEVSFQSAGVWRRYRSLQNNNGNAPTNTGWWQNLGCCLAPTATSTNPATSTTCNSFSANWAASAGATGYRLDVNTNNTFTGTWIQNNVDVGNVTTRSITGLTASTNYFYRVRPYNNCGPGPNSTTTTATTAAVAFGTVASGNQTICNGATPNSMSVSGATGSGSFTYQWYSRSGIVAAPTGTSTTGWTSLGTTSGANTATYTPASGISSSTTYACFVTPGGSPTCGTATWATSARQVTVNAVTAGVIGTAQTICSGGNPAAFTSTTAAAAFTSTTAGSGSGTITYRWESNTNLTTPSWSTIAGQTGTTYDVPSGLTTTTQYRRVAISTQNGVACESPTASVQVTVSPTSVGGTASAATATICSGSSTTVSVSGHEGTIQWQQSADGSTAWANVSGGSGATTTTYTTPNLTAITHYRAVVTSGACTAATSATATVTITPASVGGTIAGSATVCTGTNSTVLTLSGHTGSVTRWESSLDNFATAGTSIANTTTTLTATNLTATTYYRAVVTSGTCTADNSATATVTVTPATIAGSVSGDQTICANSQPANITLSGNVGSIVKWQKSSDAGFTNPIDIASTSTTLTGTVVGAISTTTYFRAVVQNGSCLSANTNSIIVSIVTTTWNGTTWDNGAPIDSNITKSIVISGNYSSTASLYGCVMQVTNNAIVTINPGHNVTLNGSLTVVPGSTFTLENNSNLIQVNDDANTGSITAKRNSALLLRLDHTLWSSPVTGDQTLHQFSPNTLTNRFYTYSTMSNSYTATPATSTFVAGKGFAIRAPNNHSSTIPTVFSGMFTGAPNNGPISFTLAMDAANGNHYNVVGNPYPSTIDLYDFLDGNPNIYGTVYFYTHSLTMNANGSFPEGTNYSSLNRTGYTLSTLLPGDLHPPLSVPNGTIQVGQGFMVRGITPGTVTFTNAMRIGNNANQFLRRAEIERHRIWLNLKTGTGADINQMMVGYIKGATKGVDRDFDGLLLGVYGSSLASKLDGANYGIQGRSLPFESNDVVPLAFKASAAGNYMISLTSTDGLFAGGQDIFVRDNLVGIDHNIKVSPYTFASDAGTFDSRFELVYTQALGIPSEDFTPNSVVVYRNMNLFHVKTKGTMMKEIKVYDASGRLIYKQSDINATTSVLTGLTQTNEVLFLKITSEDNVTVNVKVIN